jgi:hypothetical protein
MGTSLNGLAINTTYNGLLKSTDNTSLTAGFKVISDGVGNDTGLQLSTAGVKITGTLDVASASSILGLNSFGTISAGGVSVVADAANDTLTILGGSGIQVSGNSTSDTIVLNYTGDTTFVDTLNSLTGAVVLSGGSGIGVQTAGQNINITYTGSAGGVTSIESLTGAVDISGGTGISISTAGSSINIVNSGVNSVEGLTGAVDLSGGTGIGISTAGSSVGITNNGVVSLQTLTGALTFSGNNISIGTSGSNTITLSAATGGGGSTNSFGTISSPGQSSIVADQVNEVLNVVGLSGITISTSTGTNTLNIGQNIVNTGMTGGGIAYWDGTKITNTSDFSYDPGSNELTFDVQAFFNTNVSMNVGLTISEQISFGHMLLAKPSLATPANGDYGAGSKIIKFFTGTSLTEGQVYSVNTSGSAKDMVVVAVNTSAADGVLVEGVVKVSTSLTGSSIGQKVYIGNQSGSFTTTAPTASGSIVRIVGYVVEPAKSLIYFNPDTSWVENI